MLKIILILFIVVVGGTCDAIDDDYDLFGTTATPAITEAPKIVNRKKVKYETGTKVFKVAPENMDQVDCGEFGNSGKKCVSWYLCQNSSIVTDGSFLIDDRMDTGQPNRKMCESMDTCCSLEGIKEKTKEDTCKTLSDKFIMPNRCGARNVNGFEKKLQSNSDKYAQYGEFPWITAILTEVMDGTSRKKTWKYRCGGSLIHSKLVVTAAHRLLDFDASEMRVRAGEWDGQSEGELCPVQERDVEDAIDHDFNARTKENNILLLVLKQKFDFTPVVNTICLPTSTDNFESSIKPDCYATGWGSDTFGVSKYFQSFLKRIQLPVSPRTNCQNQLNNIGNGFQLTSTMMCAGGEAGKDMCTGDGGSPLSCKHPERSHSETYFLAGIVTAGVPGACGRSGVPGIYENVANHVVWIRSQMKELKLEEEYP